MPEPIILQLDDPAASFEPHRGRLRGLAYRMLGSMSEADDVAQDAYLRWHKIGGKARAQIENPRAWLSKATTRLCLDRLKSARAQRETYVGPWLPEPIVGPVVEAEAAADPAETAHDLTVAFLLLLERLSPLERAAFLLHDVFEMSFDQVAEVLRRDSAACRQLATRARKHIDAGKPRFDATSADQQRIAAAFLEAAGSGNPARLAHLLAADASLISDGGGKRAAALNPILGRDKIVAFVLGVHQTFPLPEGTEYRPSIINGLPGFVVALPSGEVDQTLSFEIVDGLVRHIYVVRNPDKLTRLHA
jgi:RNA polymerase sigma-70 factor (ECF subfamily)